MISNKICSNKFIHLFALFFIAIGYFFFIKNDFAYLSSKQFLFFSKDIKSLEYYFYGMCCSFFGIYILWESKFSSKIFWNVVLLSSFSCVFMLPYLSDDIYRYLWDGICLAKGYSPYEFLPKDKVGIHEALYSFLNSPNYYSVYPPVSQYIFYMSAFLSQGDIFFHFIIYKIFCMISFCVAIYYVQKILEIYQINKRNLYLAINPFIVTELIGQGHSEVFMIMALFAALYHYFQKQPRRTTFFFIIATLVKLYPALFVALLFRKENLWKHIFMCFAISILLFLPLYSSEMIYHIGKSVGLYTYLFSYNSAIFIWLCGLTNLILPEWVNTYGVALRICWFLFFAVYITIYWRIKSFEYTHSLLLVMFFYLMFNATVHPWYITPLLMLSILHKNSRILILWSIIIIPIYLFPIMSSTTQKIYITFEYTFIWIISIPMIKEFIILLSRQNIKRF